MFVVDKARLDKVVLLYEAIDKYLSVLNSEFVGAYWKDKHTFISSLESAVSLGLYTKREVKPSEWCVRYDDKNCVEFIPKMKNLPTFQIGNVYKDHIETASVKIILGDKFYIYKHSEINAIIKVL